MKMHTGLGNIKRNKSQVIAFSSINNKYGFNAFRANLIEDLKPFLNSEVHTVLRIKLDSLTITSTTYILRVSILQQGAILRAYDDVELINNNPSLYGYLILGLQQLKKDLKGNYSISIAP